MDATQKTRHAGSFGAAAEAYARGRPAYPAAALDWLLPPGARRVLDLGAGTGKLTRDLVGRDLDVMAVDPSDGMLAELRRGLPTVDARLGSAEALPLDGRSVDAVFVAQAWHWVDPAKAVPEVARVLRPGGRLCLLWNCRIETAGWTHDLGRLLNRLGSLEDVIPAVIGDDSSTTDHAARAAALHCAGYRSEHLTGGISRNPPVGPPFGAVERHDVAWASPISVDGLVDLVASRSYVIVLPPDEREAVLDEVRAIAAAEPAFGEGRAAMPYVTRCSRAALM